ncbi:hypothetical protein QEZ54_13700 [Catellatospora sp. KI3]|uniref:hypothetical protein n=1 Tax=Catellatospora sp. KI3 TaxID=3041620 RepID=UPI002482C3F4|nr:hypothetical protein [Catellatospora sp. KI3]MDI1462024.1 hypothetical protein [Catellatospora sp. KI3]
MRIPVGWARAGLAAGAAVLAWWGLWAYAAPAHFFDVFPGFGQHWTAAYPPFNEHLTADLGATFLTLAVLLAVPAVRYRRATARLALLGVLVFDTLHLVFHTVRHGTLDTGPLLASLVLLAGGVLLPLVMLPLLPPDPA